MSSLQVDTRERGFSYSYDAPLDMRMDPDQELTAAEVVNDWDERRLARLLRQYGEERYAGRIARAIVRAPPRGPHRDDPRAGRVDQAGVPAPARFAGGHPAKRTFQAIRIAVNDELDQLDRALPLAWSLLRKGGRIAAISFHSLEDRRVKHFLAERARGCVCPPELPVCVCGHEPEAELMTRRASSPTPARSPPTPVRAVARLRAARKLRGGGRMTPPAATAAGRTKRPKTRPSRRSAQPRPRARRARRRGSSNGHTRRAVRRTARPAPRAGVSRSGGRPGGRRCGRAPAPAARPPGAAARLLRHHAARPLESWTAWFAGARGSWCSGSC